MLIIPILMFLDSTHPSDQNNNKRPFCIIILKETSSFIPLNFLKDTSHRTIGTGENARETKADGRGKQTQESCFARNNKEEVGSKSLFVARVLSGKDYFDRNS